MVRMSMCLPGYCNHFTDEVTNIGQSLDTTLIESIMVTREMCQPISWDSLWPIDSKEVDKVFSNWTATTYGIDTCPS